MPDLSGLIQHFEMRSIVHIREKRVHIPELIRRFSPPLIFVGFMGVNLLAHAEQALNTDLAHELSFDIRILDFVDTLHGDLGRMSQREPIRDGDAVERVDGHVTITFVLHSRATIAVNHAFVIKFNDRGLLADDAHILHGAGDVVERVNQAELGSALPDFIKLINAQCGAGGHFLNRRTFGVKDNAHLVLEEVVEGEGWSAEGAIQVRGDKLADFPFRLLTVEVVFNALFELVDLVPMNGVVTRHPGFDGIVEDDYRRGFFFQDVLLDIINNVQSFIIIQTCCVRADFDPLINISGHLGFLFRSEFRNFRLHCLCLSFVWCVVVVFN